MDKKVIVDFDETLVKVNSFTHWVAFLLTHSIRKMDINLFVSVFTLVFFRKILKQLSHQDFKKKLLSLKLNDDYERLFCEKLSKQIHLKIYNHLKVFEQEGFRVIISSAAPENYLKYFIQHYIDIKDVLIIGTTIKNDLLNDNFKENKVRNLIEKNILEEDEEFDILFTDSYHDLSLAKLAGKIYLVNPKDESRRIFFEKFSNKVEVID